jgi:hypothetical protein
VTSRGAGLPGENTGWSTVGPAAFSDGGGGFRKGDWGKFFSPARMSEKLPEQRGGAWNACEAGFSPEHRECRKGDGR